MIVYFQSVGCGGTKGAVSSQVYSVLENTIVAKNKAERDLQTYTNLVSSYTFIGSVTNHLIKSFSVLY